MGIVWWLPLLLTRSQTISLTRAEALKAQNDVRSTLVTLGAALVAGLGLTFTGRTYLLNLSGQITDRYSKAVGQLADENIAVRVGSIYALERIARDSIGDRRTITDVLCTFVRTNSHVSMDASPKNPVDDAMELSTKADIQAAITVLGREPISLCGAVVDLRYTDLRGLDLSYAQLSGAWLRGCQLGGAEARAADLRGAWLSEADLTEANLESSQLLWARLRGATLNGAVLRGARLEGAILDDAPFQGSWLAGAQVTERQLTDEQKDQANGVRNIIWQRTGGG
jgi:hypothetical protein